MRQPVINISNYEEFFLLYLDGELDAAGKLAVEEFIALHPELRPELKSLEEAMLGSELMLFEGKESLYRKAGEEIDLQNYEEKFLLYVDEELDAAGKEDVETFVLQHPALQESFTALKGTRLAPEIVVFPDRGALYRKEEKERRIVWMNWQRLAVAAVLLGLAVSVWLVIQQRGENIHAPAQQFAVTKPFVARPATPSADATTGEADNQTQRDRQPAPAKDPGMTAKNRNLLSNEQQLSKQVIVRNDVPVLTADNSATPVAPKTEMAPARERSETETAVNTTSKVAAARAELENAEVAHTDISADAHVNAQPAVYREVDTDDDKKSLLLGSIEINKDKLRGFFRKAGSLFRGKAKAEEDRNEQTSPNARSLK